MRSFAAILLVALCVLVSNAVHASDPPAGAAGAAGAQQPAETQGGLFSSLQQAFSENLDRDEVRGHFDVGAPPNARRYYCLVDPKTGKREPGGVTGETVRRRDGATGVESAAVSPLSCADAEAKGLLVTAGYKLTGKAAAAAAASPRAPAVTASPGPATPVAAAAVAAPTVAPAAAAGSPEAAAPAAAASAGEPPDDAQRREVMGVFARFIVAQNAHDSGALSDVLLDSQDFLWVGESGGAIWGHEEALAAFERAWQGTWRLDPQAQGSRVASLSQGVRVLTTPLTLTSAAGRKGTHRVRWSGAFVRTPSGWRIASIFITPLTGAHAAE